MISSKHTDERSFRENSPTLMESEISTKLSKHAWTVVVVYILAGLAWIFFSDYAVNTLFAPQEAAKLQIFKGFFFIFSTAGILFVIIQRKNNSIRDLFLKLRRHMQNFKDTFEQSAVGMAHISVDGEWIRVNKKLCDILGYSRSELLKLETSGLTHPIDVETSRKNDQQLISGARESYIIEKRYITKSGEPIFVRLTKSAIKKKNGEIKYLSSIIEDITKQKEAEHQLVDSLDHKKRLLAEIHHRVKNNLAIISGLLELQAFNTTNNLVKKILKKSLMRIKSMALMHESYYKSEELNEVYLDEYLEEFADYIKQTFVENKTQIDLKCSTDSIPLNINQAIPCGLLLNELLINAYLHAFPRRKKGLITINLKKQGNGVILQVRDDGVGLPESFDLENPSTLGMTIIKTLTKQLNGTTTINRDHGTFFTTTFAKEHKRGSASNIIGDLPTATEASE